MKQEEKSGPCHTSSSLLTPPQAEGEFAEFSLNSPGKVSFGLPVPTAYGQLATASLSGMGHRKLILRRERSDQKP